MSERPDRRTDSALVTPAIQAADRGTAARSRHVATPGRRSPPWRWYRRFGCLDAAPRARLFQIPVLAAQLSIAPQGITERQQCPRMRIRVLNQLQMMRARLRPRPQEPQPVVAARIVWPEQPARLLERWYHRRCGGQRGHRSEHVDHGLGPQPGHGGRPDVLNRRGQIRRQHARDPLALPGEAARPTRVGTRGSTFWSATSRTYPRRCGRAKQAPDRSGIEKRASQSRS